MVGGKANKGGRGNKTVDGRISKHGRGNKTVDGRISKGRISKHGKANKTVDGRINKDGTINQMEGGKVNRCNRSRSSDVPLNYQQDLREMADNRE